MQKSFLLVIWPQSNKILLMSWMRFLATLLRRAEDLWMIELTPVIESIHWIIYNFHWHRRTKRKSKLISSNSSIGWWNCKIQTTIHSFGKRRSLNSKGFKSNRLYCYPFLRIKTLKFSRYCLISLINIGKYERKSWNWNLKLPLIWSLWPN